ncbi:MAG: signal peptidase I [Aphanocapsa feldmannii 277cV]|uniref:Signal peptidase I n=1 Tax=Aphanocapsa feldmannii 277cV TaxID=2507553 RepID=A0A524RNV4_9CHRO|nr:MAG: signal peptidase I [Aphanocapsa feldmannii 288cV]TGG93031.1 MAG: signal peptidase I [Aphanocapsa feldmannii 277cV]
MPSTFDQPSSPERASCSRSGDGPPEAGGQPGRWRGLRSMLIALCIALLLRWGVVEPRWIPSGSMLPTLQLQDRVLVEKVRQRLGLALRHDEIVVFRPPAALVARGYDPDKALIKRVIGLPGDLVEIRGGVLIRNGQPMADPWPARAMDYRFGPVRVPARQALVLGDNRNESLDSHLWGPLPLRNIQGRAVFRYWPPARIGLLD